MPSSWARGPPNDEEHRPPGDVDQREAGSASGSLSAVQQIAGALGAAVITSVWFGAVATGVPPAMIRSLAVVAAVLVGCCCLVALLPRNDRVGPRGGSSEVGGLSTSQLVVDPVLRALGEPLESPAGLLSVLAFGQIAPTLERGQVIRKTASPSWRRLRTSKTPSSACVYMSTTESVVFQSTSGSGFRR